LNIFAFSIFLFELVINTIALPDYFLSFFFWLDLCSTFSLLLEIKIAMNTIIGNINYRDDQLINDGITISRASRGAQIGSRAGKITRMVRLLRLVSMVKHYKNAYQSLASFKKKDSTLSTRFSELKLSNGE